MPELLPGPRALSFTKRASDLYARCIWGIKEAASYYMLLFESIIHSVIFNSLTQSHFLVPAFAVDAAGRISAWNNAPTELLGLSEAEALGVKCHQMLQCSDENGVVCSDHCIVECASQVNPSRTNFRSELNKEHTQRQRELHPRLSCPPIIQPLLTVTFRRLRS